MNKLLKKILIGFAVIVATILLGYGTYKLYNYIVKDVTQKIRKGVSEGIGEGVGGAMNPLKWPGKIFGGK